VVGVWVVHDRSHAVSIPAYASPAFTRLVESRRGLVPVGGGLAGGQGLGQGLVLVKRGEAVVTNVVRGQLHHVVLQVGGHRRVF
jgi:hypothetical protein